MGKKKDKGFRKPTDATNTTDGTTNTFSSDVKYDTEFDYAGGDDFAPQNTDETKSDDTKSDDIDGTIDTEETTTTAEATAGATPEDEVGETKGDGQATLGDETTSEESEIDEAFKTLLIGSKGGSSSNPKLIIGTRVTLVDYLNKNYGNKLTKEKALATFKSVPGAGSKSAFVYGIDFRIANVAAYDAYNAIINIFTLATTKGLSGVDSKSIKDSFIARYSELSNKLILDFVS